MRELNRLGVTSVIDAGDGFQNYPDDYKAIEELHRRGQMTLRVAYNLFTQRPNHELEDFARWTSTTQLHQGDHTLRLNGAGEMLVFSAADFEDFLEPRPDLNVVQTPREFRPGLGCSRLLCNIRLSLGRGVLSIPCFDSRGELLLHF
jgi:predicted amidohydrolase YtcJ